VQTSANRPANRPEPGMQPLSNENQPPILNPTDVEENSPDSATEGPSLFWFHSHFVGSMEMYASAQAVADYLDIHQEWFRRCAAPMTAEPLGQNGYALTIGHYGAFNHYVEPKIGLELLPQQERVYRIQTIPVPNYTPPGYDVDFQAVQTLVEIAPEETNGELTITRVEWELKLGVGVQFPQFILKLSSGLIQKTGDGLISQIVKQVSRRLTHKVQEDFHTQQGRESLNTFQRVRKQRQSFSCQPKTQDTPVIIPNTDV
jgi:Protein of unknown function (DUF1997)